MATASGANQSGGVVSGLRGNAWIVNADGSRTALKEGDTIEAGQKVLTEDGAQLQLTLPNGQTLDVASGRELLIDTTLLGVAPVDATEAALATLNAGTAEIAQVLATGGDLSAQLEATALGLGGGDSSDSHGFVRIDRIEEALTPLDIARDADAGGIDQFPTGRNTGVPNTAPDTTAPTLAAQAFSYNEQLAAGATVGTVTAVDAVGVTGYRFAATGTQTSADGFFEISNTGVITLTAAGAASAVNSFTQGPNARAYDVTAVDAAGNATSAAITLSELEVNQAPVNTLPAAQTATEDVALAVTGVSVNDVNGNLASVEISVQHGVLQVTLGGATLSAGANGSATLTLSGTQAQINAALSTLTYRGDANFNGSDALRVVATDSAGVPLSATSAVAINVTPVIDVPTATPSTSSGDEDTNIAVELSGTDPDGTVSSVQVTVLPSAAQGVLYLGDGTTAVTTAMALTPAQAANLVFTPAANFNGNVTLSFTVTDNENNTSAPANEVITVTAVDDAFVDANEAVTILEDSGPLTGTVLSGTSSVDGPVTASSFQITGNPAVFTAGTTATIASVGTLLINTDGSYTFTPDANYNGTVPVATYTLSDGSSGDTSTLAITVTAVDDASVMVADSKTVAEDNVASGNVLDNDSDVDNSLSVAAFKVAGDTATYAFGTTATIAGQGTLAIAANGEYTFTPELNFNGALPQVTYTTNTGSTSTLDITVTPVNDAPVAVADTLAATEDTTLTITSTNLFGADGTGATNDLDVDSGSFASITITALASNGTLQLNGVDVTLNQVITAADIAAGKLSFVPTSNFNGAAVFNYSVSDGALSSAPVAVTINVAAVNDAATVSSQTIQVVEGNAASDLNANGQLTITDPDTGEAFAVAQTSIAGTYGTFNVQANGSWTYTGC